MRPPQLYGRSCNGGTRLPVPKGKAYLKALWQNKSVPRTAFRIEPVKINEHDPVIKKVWRILREGDDNRGPGYDQITYRTLRQCEKMSLIMWLIHTFRLQTKQGVNSDSCHTSRNPELQTHKLRIYGR